MLSARLSRCVRYLLLIAAGLPGVAAQPAAPTSLSFDVASVKIRPPGVRKLPNGVVLPVYGAGPPGKVEFSEGKLSADGASARRLILAAYRLPRTQLTGGPDWLDYEHFDIEAKASGPAEEAELRRMLQSLLEERFKLVVHHVTKVMHADAIVVGKKGSKLQPWTSGQPLPPMPLKKHIAGAYRGHGTLAQLAYFLAGDFSEPYPVVDKTGLAGDFVIQFQWRENETMRHAIRDLGLRTRGVRTAVDILVVDSIDRPSEN